MMKWITATLLSVLVVLVHSQGMAGPYECAKITGIGVCEDKDPNDTMELTLRMRRVKEGKVGDGTFVLPCDFDDTVSGNVTFYKKDNGGYKEMLPMHFKNLCSEALDKAPEIVKAIFKSINHKDNCPVPKGKYTMKDMVGCVHLKNFPVLPYGDYRARFIMMKDGKRIGCASFEMTVEPKARNLG